MQFGILFISQPNLEIDEYPHHGVHPRVTGEVILADELGYDVAWLAEHHFSNTYGIMPDVMTYGAYLAGLTKTIKLGTGVVVLPLNNPVRVVENMCFIDVLSGGRFMLGLGSGYRAYEFQGLGVDFATRRDIQIEGLELLMQLLTERRADFNGRTCRSLIEGDHELFPHPLQKPYPPLTMAVASEQSMAAAARYGFGIMLSSIPTIDVCAAQGARYREMLSQTEEKYKGNIARGDLILNRFVYVADTDEAARKESEEGVLRHLSHYFGQGDYVNMVQKGAENAADTLAYDELLGDVVIHGSPDTVATMIEEMAEKTGMTGLILHYPPYYGPERIRRSLTLFGQEVMPRFRKGAKTAAAE
jgi:alkanesulfonate monooxygenase SsuD/methylene tetrahydromethanopterin reductase-like flavin-dependent oxidoreductase (luciferase family)